MDYVQLKIQIDNLKSQAMKEEIAVEGIEAAILEKYGVKGLQDVKAWVERCKEEKAKIELEMKELESKIKEALDGTGITFN